MKFCLSVIISITWLFLVILALSSIFCITAVSNIRIASGIDSSPSSTHAGIGSSFTLLKERANSTSAFKITDETKNRTKYPLDSNKTNAAISADWNDLKPMQNVTAKGLGGANDYSNWTYTYNESYHNITS